MHSIFNYLDYREYLAYAIKNRKEHNPHISFRFLSKKLQIDASNIAKIVQGKRHLSLKSVQPVISFLQLSRREARYFETLVLLNREKNSQKRLLLEKRLLDIKYLSPQKVVHTQYEYYQKWYTSAILALLYYFEFSGDYKELGEKLDPTISPAEARESIQTLERLNLIKTDDKGIYRHTHELLSTGDEWTSIAIRSFQRETLQLALRSFETHNKGVRDISTATITVDPKDLPELRKATEEYRNRVLHIIEESENPHQVYQLNIQLFPLTKGAPQCS